MSIIPIRRSGRGPVQRHAVYIDVDRIFAEFGLAGLYEEAFQHLEAQQRAGFDLAATSEERDRITVIEANIPETETLDAAALHLVREATDISQRVADRARTDKENPFNAARRALEAIDELWFSDQDAYVATDQTVLRRALLHRGVHDEVELLDEAEPLRVRPASEWDAIAADLHQAARQTTPLPMTGAAPDWTTGTPADALRRANLTYIDRLRVT